MIRSILFDLGNVIVPFDFSIGYREIEKRCGHSPETIRERIRGTGLVPRFETGLVEPEPFVRQICEAVGITLTHGEFASIWSSIFSRKTLIPDEFLAALHKRYRLVLLSNTNALHFEMIRENYPLLCHFDAQILSYEVQAMKPSPAIFAAAVSAAKVPPGECFFTDDIPEYVDAACRFGIDAVVFRGFAQLQSDLTERGVTWESY